MDRLRKQVHLTPTKNTKKEKETKKMKRTFEKFETYIKSYDGAGKPKLNLREMYELFPELTFTPTEDFGSYKDYGRAYGHKVYDMVVTANNGDECYVVYKEYSDANENLVYISMYTTRK